MATVDPVIDVTVEERAIIRRLLEQHLPGTAAWVYGSRARCTSSPTSDLDLVVFATPDQRMGIIELREAFEESDLPFRVDLFAWNDLSETFKRQIEAKHTVLDTGISALTADKCSLETRGWREMSFSEAVQINPKVRLNRRMTYAYVDMASINVGSKSVHPREHREYRGGGSRFLEGDTLMARITPCLENGKIAQYRTPDSDIRAYGSTEFIVVRGRAGITDNEFAYYLTKSDSVRNYAIGQMTGTSGRQRVSTDALGYLRLLIPPLSEQRAIAYVLGTLDDKIELNRRINETLEAIARALFKSWFVDFDPVRAKMEGLDIGLPQEIADLFPDRMVDSEIGEIPEGWEVGSLMDYMNLTMGQSPPGSTYNDHGIGLPFFQGRSEFGFRYPEVRRFCSAPTRVANPYDTLVSVRAPVGDINLAWEQCCIGRGVAALRHKLGSSSFTYYSAWTLQREFIEYEHAGTVFGAINKRQFQALKITEPDPHVVKAFDAMSANLDAQIRLNIAASATLVGLRDILLPRLISGALRVHIGQK